MEHEALSLGTVYSLFIAAEDIMLLFLIYRTTIKFYHIMKKNYIKPSVEVYELASPETILAFSTEGAGDASEGGNRPMEGRDAFHRSWLSRVGNIWDNQW